MTQVMTKVYKTSAAAKGALTKSPLNPDLFDVVAVEGGWQIALLEDSQPEPTPEPEDEVPPTLVARPYLDARVNAQTAGWESFMFVAKVVSETAENIRLELSTGRVRWFEKRLLSYLKVLETADGERRAIVETKLKLCLAFDKRYGL